MYINPVSYLCLCMISISQVYATADPMWMNDLVNDVKNKPVPTLVSELAQKATGEFDKMYQQLEGILGQLKEGWNTPEVEAQLDPKLLSECNCYCRCPHDTVNSKVMAQVKNSVIELKKKVESMGISLKDKIRELTSR